MADQIKIDNRPYEEVNDTYAESNRWSKGVLYLALGAVGLKGASFAASNLTIDISPEKLKYLNAGLQNTSTPWWEVAGLQKDASGKVKAPLKVFGLEGIKRFEESVAGIPRTFGLFGVGSRGVFTSANTTLRISGEDLKGAWSHYEQLIKGAKGTTSPLDKIRGFIVQPSNGRPALFRVGDDGKSLGAPLVEDVNVQVRRWFPGGVDDKFKQIIRSVDTISEGMGALPIAHGNDFNFVVNKAHGDIRISGIAQEVLSAFGDTNKMASGISEVLPEGARQGIRDASVFTRRMTERYMKVLDQPIEFIEETLHGGKSSNGLLSKARDSKPYSFFKNILGAGGDYSGTTLDIWARHAFRLGVLGVGVAAAYEGASLITNTLLNRDPTQIGGEIIGAAQRAYAATSDLTGLTSLNKTQEENAPGSGRFLAQVGFGLSGYLTGRVLAVATNPIATPSGEMPWRFTRQKTSEAPELLKKIVSGPMTRGTRFGLIGAAIGAIAAAPFLLGSLGSSESYDELVAEQRGETEVAVRKGAYWEGGRSDMEGNEVSYYRPGWFRRMLDEPADELQFADLGDRPFTRMVKSITDPYWREKEFYKDRPYPVAGPDGSGMGPLGPIYAATLGQVIKPTKYMHADEVSPGGIHGVASGQTVSTGSDTSIAPSVALGADGGGGAVSPYGWGNTASETISRASQAIGLPGFAISSIAEKVGLSSKGDELPTLQSFSDVGSLRDRFWDLNLGGGATSTESIRRLLPKDRQGMNWVNPIQNTMPDWLPGAEYFQDFKRGDAYGAIPEGEYRLPGSGYETRFPELKGVNPEDYPDIHRYKILADVAPFSEQFKDIREEIEGRASSGNLNEYENAIFRGTKAQLIEKDEKVTFGEHTGFFGGYWETIKKLGRVNPVEHLLPFSPVHKTAGALDAISEYESRNVYSTANPSWSSPIDDFVKPAINNAARILGYDGIPRPEADRRDLIGYFDRLEYMKDKGIATAARAEGQGRVAFSYDRKAESTMYGADPFGDIDSILKVLPSEERPYFREFVATEDPKDKGHILDLVPEYTKKFYVSQWQKNTYAALAAKGDLSSDEVVMARQIEASRALEGETASVSQWNDYMDEVGSGEVLPNQFADYIRAQRLGNYFEDESPLGAPPTDWLGYDPSISFDSIKLKVVQNLGMDHHDFGLWDDDLAMAQRQPYLDSAANELIDSRGQDREEIISMLKSARLTDLEVDIAPTNSGRTRISFDIGSDRTESLRSELKRAGLRVGA